MVPGCEHHTSGAKVTSGRRSRQFFWLLGSPCSLSVRRSQPGLRRLSINYTSHPPIRGPRNGLLPQIQMSKMQSAFEGFALGLAGRMCTNIKNASAHLPRDLKIKSICWGCSSVAGCLPNMHRRDLYPQYNKTHTYIMYTYTCIHRNIAHLHIYKVFRAG